MNPQPETPTFRQALPVWVKIGLLSFGGPAGQIALMHRELVEKRGWLEWAAKEFAASDAGRRIRVNLIPMGSVESARAIVNGDQRLHVWSPARVRLETSVP